jgi:hypothetical protein
MNDGDLDARDVLCIAELLERRVGYEVDLFKMLYVRELENGEFAVGTEEAKDELLFADATEAAKAFVKKRGERRLGFDHEAVPTVRPPG